MSQLTLLLYNRNSKTKRADMLILDELSYLSFNRHQSKLLFKVISDRSEKGSTSVTINLPFSKWTDLFENTTMVAALIDRLTFRSHVLDMYGNLTGSSLHSKARRMLPFRWLRYCRAHGSLFR